MPVPTMEFISFLNAEKFETDESNEEFSTVRFAAEIQKKRVTNSNELRRKKLKHLENSNIFSSFQNTFDSAGFYKNYPQTFIIANAF